MTGRWSNREANAEGAVVPCSLLMAMSWANSASMVTIEPKMTTRRTAMRLSRSIPASRLMPSISARAILMPTSSEIEPAARVPAGEDARDQILDRHEEEDREADGKSDEKADLRAGMPRDPLPCG